MHERNDPTMDGTGPATADLVAVRSGRLTISRLHRTGARPARVLVIGDRSALDAAEDDGGPAAFSSLLADRLWLRLQRGLDLDVLWDLRPVLEAIRRGPAAWRLWRYDVVVLLESGASRLHRRAADRLVQAVLPELAAVSPVLLVRDPSGAASGARERVTEVAGRTDRHGQLELLTDEVARLLGGAPAAGPAGGRRPDDETERQAALDALDLPTRPVSQRLLRIVDITREALLVRYAQITMVDHDELWALVSAGLDRGVFRRANSLCDRTISGREPVIAPDLLDLYPEERLPVLPDGGPIRFFAAHPIESIDGYRIGALCVFDSVPREAEDVDVVALRDLALLAEAEIVADRRDAEPPVSPS
ncbi:MAG: GAF domain-containing protein [Amnibacterium sp.]